MQERSSFTTVRLAQENHRISTLCFHCGTGICIFRDCCTTPQTFHTTDVVDSHKGWSDSEEQERKARCVWSERRLSCGNLGSRGVHVHSSPDTHHSGRRPPEDAWLVSSPTSPATCTRTPSCLLLPAAVQGTEANDWKMHHACLRCSGQQPPNLRHRLSWPIPAVAVCLTFQRDQASVWLTVQ